MTAILSRPQCVNCKVYILWLYCSYRRCTCASNPIPWINAPSDSSSSTLFMVMETHYWDTVNMTNSFSIHINSSDNCGDLVCPTAVTTVPGGPVPLPRELTFTSDSLISVIAYSVLFVIATVGNLTVFVTLFRNRRRRSRVNLFIMHLSIADMIVTFIMLPEEIAWHITVAWIAGDAACRFFMFFRVFGFYLSSFILITISLDRYFAITHPLSLNDADRRGKLMLALAWLFSSMASIPQVG